MATGPTDARLTCCSWVTERGVPGGSWWTSGSALAKLPMGGNVVKINLTKSVYGTGLVKNKHLHPILPYQSGCLASEIYLLSFPDGGRKTYPIFSILGHGVKYSLALLRYCNILHGPVDFTSLSYFNNLYSLCDPLHFLLSWNDINGLFIFLYLKILQQ